MSFSILLRLIKRFDKECIGNKYYHTLTLICVGELV